MWRWVKGMRDHIAAAVLVFLLARLTVRDSPVPTYDWVRGFGMAAIVMLCLALMIGPLARLVPRYLGKLLPARRAVGIWAAVATGLHLYFVLAAKFYAQWQWLWVRPSLRGFGLDTTGVPVVPGQYALGTHFTVVVWLGTLSGLILGVLALTSNDWVQRLLGQSAWKLVQQQAYTAFLFAGLHVLLLTYGGRLKGMPPIQGWVLPLLGVVLLLQFAGFVWTIVRHRMRESNRKAA